METNLTDLTVQIEQEVRDIEAMFAELSQNVGMDLRDELLALFFPTLDECLVGLANSLASDDVPTTISFAHKLKGAAAQLGATQIASHSKAIEVAAKTGDFAATRLPFHLVNQLGQAVGAKLRVA
jgi:HPt (histidine-containing phosphotransfer) domain-containing protein